MKIKFVIINISIRIELDNIYNYIQLDSKDRAEKFVNNILDEIENLILFPEKGRVIPELNLNHFRELIVNNYRILYRIEKETIFILAILHMSREFNLDV